MNRRIGKQNVWAGQNTGHLASREDSSRDAGHRGWNTGRPGKYGTVGKPIHQVSDWSMATHLLQDLIQV